MRRELIHVDPAFARTINRRLVRPLEQLGAPAALLEEFGDVIPA